MFDRHRAIRSVSISPCTLGNAILTNSDNDIFWKKKLCEWSYQDAMEPRREPGQVVVDQGKRQYFAFLFADLESFLDELVSDTTTPFVPRACTHRGGDYDFSTLAQRYFTKIPEFLKLVECMPPQLLYSEHVEAFIACCKEMGLFGQTLDWDDIWFAPSLTYPQFGNASAAELFNLLVANLRDRCLSQKIQARARKRQSEAVERAEEYGFYVDALLRQWTRLVVLRIDLEYRQEFKDQIGISGALADLKRFFRNQRRNLLFAEQRGYIVKLEYGVRKGLHFHLILFFDGSERDGSEVVDLAKEIGEYWEKVITKGRGNYRNVNASKKKYEQRGQLGIAVIEARQTNLVENLKQRVVGYLCKSTQYVTLRRPEVQKTKRKIKTIRRGEFPVEPPKKLGRPRKTQALP